MLFHAVREVWVEIDIYGPVATWPVPSVFVGFKIGNRASESFSAAVEALRLLTDENQLAAVQAGLTGRFSSSGVGSAVVVNQVGLFLPVRRAGCASASRRRNWDQAPDYLVLGRLAEPTGGPGIRPKAVQ